jgi:hypothetical protein
MTSNPLACSKLEFPIKELGCHFAVWLEHAAVPEKCVASCTEVLAFD